MSFKTVLLLVSAIVTGYVIFAEAGCIQSKHFEKKINVKGRRAVEYANSQINPLEALKKPPTFVSNDGETMTVECIIGRSLSGELLEWVKNLLYRDSEFLGDELKSLGWTSETRWLNTLLSDTTYLLIVRSSSKTPVGFAHFRFEMDWKNDIEVVYLWDLLVESSNRGRGIGSYILDTITALAKPFNMRKTVLTVLKSNKRAIKLYKQHRFSVDKITPEQDLYYILSRPNTSFKG